jgi:hypothetical protein
VRLIVPFTGALLIGCVDSFSQLKSEIPQYRGQKIDALIDRFGYPESQTFSAGGIVYVWTTDNSRQMDSGPIKTQSVEIFHGQILANVSAPVAVNLRFRCALEVATDGAGIILHLSWDQEHGGCGP